MRTQGRRSRLIIRRVDPWTILKFSVLLFTSTYFVIVVAGLVLWAAATGSGVRGNIESFVGELIASEDFKFNAEQILRSSVIGGAILVVVGSLTSVLMAVLFNLISDVVGGIGISVEERAPRRRRRAARRRSPEGAAPRDGKDARDAKDGRAGRDAKDGPASRGKGKPSPLRPSRSASKTKQVQRPPGGHADLGG